jgi:amino acid adenylation domain-containing protein
MSELSTVEFLSHLRDLDVKVWADRDQLRVSAPAGILSPELHKGLRTRKQELLQFFKEAIGAYRPSPKPMERVSRDGELALSFAQTRLWLLDQLDPSNIAYNVPAQFRFKGVLNQPVLEQSLAEIVRRHEILRTYYMNVDGNIVQRLAPPAPLKVPVIDLQSLPEAEREKEVERLGSASVYAAQPFDLTEAPLIRATLLRLAADEHVLFVDIHHIAVDGWSFGVLVEELSSLYDAFLQGKPSPLLELPIQYADFAAWQREWLQGDVLEKQLDYWKTRLAGLLPPLELPTDRPRPAVQTYNGGKVSFAISKPLTNALKVLSHQEDVTLFVLLLTAFNVLLLRYSGQEDVLVGTPIANRNRQEIEGLIGFFVNTLVMRSDLSGDPQFRTLLRQTRNVALGAYENQDLPFDKLVEELRPERQFSRSPIFQVMFVLQNAPLEPLKLPGLEPSRLDFRTGGAHFDLTLYLEESPQGLKASWSYNTDLFDEATISAMAEHYCILLEGIVSNPDQQVRELPLLAPRERETLLVDWNKTSVEFTDPDTLHELVALQAAKTPEARAVEFEGRHLTYRELNGRANQVANYLKGLGAGPDVLVGLFVERSMELIVALLGILKAGSAYVPLDPSFPPERLAYMVEDSGMRLLVTRKQLDRTLPLLPAVVVHLDSDSKKIAQQSFDQPAPPDLNPHNLAYVLYTSGSTGKPKGVEIPHSALVNFLLSMKREPGFTATDTLLAVTTLSFDIAGLELFLPLVSGGSVVIASRADAIDPARLMERMQKSACTVMQATPATWRALVDAGWRGSANLRLLCGGEALPPDLARELLPRCAELWNMYGPTETTVWSTAYRVESANGSVPIGRPIANTQILVLDANRNLVPRCAIGELYIGGSGLARGYLRREELTRQRFVPSPFARNSLLYRTGDLGRWLPDGTIECLGRVDNQVKIRGFRIELGEIEAILSAHQAIRQCAVIAREDKPGDKQLVAYFETQKGVAPAVGDLRAHLEKELPAYMVPSIFMGVERLPLTLNGKVDRKALPTPTQSLEATHDFAAPRDPIEQLLARIWESVLKVKPVGLNDNFFHLGGHSLLAVRIVVEVERLSKIRLPLAALLQAPTVAGLAELLRQKHWVPSWSSLVPIRPGGSLPPLFLMHAHGGNVLEYYPLANLLDADQPVYALQARGLDGRIPKDQSLEKMAAAYLAELRALQSEGPYYLGGFCFGGLVALETARQLRASGEKVALVVLIQTMHPAASQFRRGTSLLHRLWYRVAKQADLEWETLRARGANQIRERLRRVWDVGWARTQIACDRLLGSRRAHPSMPYILESLGIEHDRAFDRYEPSPYFGDVVLYRSHKQLRGLIADVSLGWKDLISGNLCVHEIPGHQQSILSEPNVSILATDLTARLHAAATGHNTNSA